MSEEVSFLRDRTELLSFSEMRSLGLFVMGIAGGWFLHLHLARQPIPAPPVPEIVARPTPRPSNYVNPLTRGSYDQRHGVARAPTIYWTAPVPTPIPR